MTESSFTSAKWVYRCGVALFCIGDALVLLAVLDDRLTLLQEIGLNARQVFVFAGCFLMAGWLLERSGARRAKTGVWVTSLWKRSLGAALLFISFLFLIITAAFQNEATHDTISDAAYTGDLATVKRLAPFDPQLSRTGYESHYTPLCAAAMMGHRPIVEYLLSRGVDVNRLSDHKETPLGRARNHEIRALLIAAGAYE